MMTDGQSTYEIDSLDLRSVKRRLMHRTRGEGWTKARTDAAELQYRRFLFLMKAFPNENVAPFEDVDTFWHYHILDTLNYAADCQRAFGYFLHHVPGSVDPQHDIARTDAVQRMQDLYERAFGQPVNARSGFCGVSTEDQIPCTAGYSFCGVSHEGRAGRNGASPSAKHALGAVGGTHVSVVSARTV